MTTAHPAASAFPRCPLAARGVSPLLRACPGHTAEAVRFHGPGQALRCVESCGHLRAEPTGRGFAACCHHPRAATVTAAARLVERLPHLRWSMVETAPCSVIVTDAEGVVTHWNAAATAMYGWGADEALGRHVEDLTVGPQSTEDAAAIMAHLAAGRPYEGTFTATTRSGRPMRIRIIDVPLLDARATVAGIAGFSCRWDDPEELPRLRAAELGAVLDDGVTLLAPSPPPHRAPVPVAPRSRRPAGTAIRR